MFNYFPIDLCDDSSDFVTKVVILNLDNQKQHTFEVKDGHVLTLSELNPQLLEGIQIPTSLDTPISLLIPQLREIILVNLDERFGVYQRMQQGLGYKLSQGATRVGLPAGHKTIDIVVKKQIVRILDQEYDLEKLNFLVFVRSFTKDIPLENQVKIKNSTSHTSRVHFSLHNYNGYIEIKDGYKTTNSHNGTWLLMKKMRLVQNQQYCIHSFMLRLML